MGFSCVCTRKRKHLLGGLGAGSEVSHLINMPHRLTQLNHTLLRFNFPSPIFHFTHPDQPPSTRTHVGYPVGMVFEQSCECTGPLYVPLTRTHAGYPVGTVFEQSGECTGHFPPQTGAKSSPNRHARKASTDSSSPFVVNSHSPVLSFRHQLYPLGVQYLGKSIPQAHHAK